MLWTRVKIDRVGKFVKFDTIRPKFTHDGPTLNAEFDGNLRPPAESQPKRISQVILRDAFANLY